MRIQSDNKTMEVDEDMIDNKCKCCEHIFPLCLDQKNKGLLYCDYVFEAIERELRIKGIEIDGGFKVS